MTRNGFPSPRGGSLGTELEGMVKVFKVYQEAYCSCLNCTGKIQQTARNQCISSWADSDAAKSVVKSFKLRWPVRSHVMFDGMLINNHLRLVLCPHPPRSPPAPDFDHRHRTTLCCLICWLPPLGCRLDNVLFSVQLAMCRLRRVRVKTWGRPPSSNHQASMSSSKPFKSCLKLYPICNCKTIQMQILKPLLPVNMCCATLHFATCPNDADWCGTKCVSVDAAFPFPH